MSLTSTVIFPEKHRAEHSMYTAEGTGRVTSLRGQSPSDTYCPETRAQKDNQSLRVSALVTIRIPGTGSSFPKCPHLFPLFVLEVLEFLWWLSQEKICLQCRRTGFDSWVGKISWRREWLPTPVFLPGEFHGQRSCLGYSPWGRKESDMTKQLTLSLFTFFFKILIGG